MEYVDPTILPVEYSPLSECGPYSSEKCFNETCKLHDWFVTRSYFGVQENVNEQQSSKGFSEKVEDAEMLVANEPEL